MNIDISKMVEDGKQSPSSRGAFIFYAQNIANLVRAMPEGANAELADVLHNRAEDMANVIFGHHFATAPAAVPSYGDSDHPYPIDTTQPMNVAQVNEPPAPAPTEPVAPSLDPAS